jgi:hypothetical protein
MPVLMAGIQSPEHDLEGLNQICALLMWERIDEGFELRQ